MKYAGKNAYQDHPGKDEQFAIWVGGFLNEGQVVHMSADLFLKIYNDMRETYKMYFGRYGPIRIPEDRKPQYWSIDSDGNPLPDNGFPRITSEALEILKEGLNGDFRRWKCGIGNHPYELPANQIRNITICATPEGDHFVAKPWTGMYYPMTDKNTSAIPWYAFDEIDEAYDQRIMLKRSDDFWFGLPVFLDSYGDCGR